MIRYKHKKTGEMIVILFTEGNTNYYYDEDGKSKAICNTNLKWNYERVW